MSDKISTNVANPVLTVTFTEAIRTNFDTFAPTGSLFDFKFTNGTSLNSQVSATYSINGAVVTITLAPSATETVLPQGQWIVGLTNQWQSLGYDDSVVAEIPIDVDTIAPVVSTIVSVNSGTQGKVFNINITFSEAVSFASTPCSSCLTESTATPYGVIIADVSSGSDHIICSVTTENDDESTPETPLVLSFAATCAPVTDLAGNPYTQAAASSESFQFDAYRPFISSISSGQVVSDSPSFFVPCPFNFTVQWSEPLSFGQNPPAMSVTIGTNTQSYDNPVVIANDQSFTYTVSGPHCIPNGNTINGIDGDAITIAFLGSVSYVSFSQPVCLFACYLLPIHSMQRC